MSVLQKIADTIVDKAVDFSQINVHTYSGKLEITPGANVKPEDVLKSVMSGALTDPDSKIKLVAGTVVRIDGDIDQFFSSDGLSPGLEEAHKAAVESSKQYRQAIINIATGFLKGT